MVGTLLLKQYNEPFSLEVDMPIYSCNRTYALQNIAFRKEYYILFYALT